MTTRMVIKWIFISSYKGIVICVIGSRHLLRLRGRIASNVHVGDPFHPVCFSLGIGSTTFYFLSSWLDVASWVVISSFFVLRALMDAVYPSSSIFLCCDFQMFQKLWFLWDADRHSKVASLLAYSYMRVWSHKLGHNSGHPSMDRRNEYQPKGGDALRLASKGSYGSRVGDR